MFPGKGKTHYKKKWKEIIGLIVYTDVYKLHNRKKITCKKYMHEIQTKRHDNDRGCCLSVMFLISISINDFLFNCMEHSKFNV